MVGNSLRGQVQWSVETTKGLVDSVKTTAHGKLQETLTSIKGTYVTRWADKYRIIEASGYPNTKDYHRHCGY